MEKSLTFDKHEGWTDLKEKCEEENLYFSELYLQYKSHQEVIDTKDSDGIYINKICNGSNGR